MKTIGLVGGTTWHSTLDYYRYFNEMIAAETGEFESAKVMINSLNFGEIKALQHADDWQKISDIICRASMDLEKGGADCIMLGANTIHRFADDVRSAINIPLIHIADETAAEIKKLDITSVALLGTKYTMQLSFFRDNLFDKGIHTLIPDEEAMVTIDTAICEELCKGLVLDPTKKSFIEIIDTLAGLGADGVILGCTEIPMLIKTQDCPLPLFDTTKIHARAGVDFALGKKTYAEN